SQGRHAAISAAAGVRWIRRLPFGCHLKCLTTLVSQTSLSSIPATARQLRSRIPAGPTKGRPLRSSTSPGCSPTITTRARDGPSPKTALVASRHRSQPRQRWTACASTSRVASGTMSSAGVGWLCSTVVSPQLGAQLLLEEGQEALLVGADLEHG